MNKENPMVLQATVSKNAFRYGYLLKRIFPYIKKVMFRAVLGIIIAIPLGLLDGVTALALKPYLDYVVNGSSTATFTFLHWTFKTRLFWEILIPPAIVLFAIFQGGLKYANNYLTDWTGMKMANSIKIDLFKKLTSLDARFYDLNTSGIVLTRFLSDPDTASRSIIDNVKTFISTIFGILGLVGVLLYTAWKLAIIGVVVLGIAMLPVAFIRKKVKSVSNASMVIGGGMTTNFNETFSGNKIVTAYSLKEDRDKLFELQIKDQFDLAMSLTKRVGWLSPIMYFVASIGIALVMAYGNHLIVSGELSSGSFAAFVTSLLLLYKPVKGLGQTLAGLQNTFVAMSRTFELFDLVPLIKNAPNALALTDVNKGIEFKDVCFEYEENEPVLKHINLSVKKGEMLALVGNSGGGKSTIVNLIPRFYDVTSGSVMIDGKDVKEYELESLRKNISFVFQDNFLFSGTLRENLLMGNKNATDFEIQKALEMAHIDEFVASLEEGIDTAICERGTTLSGGQRQRIAIARALLKDAPIVILDEATSALDNQSEEIVQKAIDNLMKNKTVLVIAHRLSTIRNANRIAVINEGNLVELGTHDELMQIQDGNYKHLYEMQFAKSSEAQTIA